MKIIPALGDHVKVPKNGVHGQVISVLYSSRSAVQVEIEYVGFDRHITTRWFYLVNVEPAGEAKPVADNVVELKK